MTPQVANATGPCWPIEDIHRCKRNGCYRYVLAPSHIRDDNCRLTPVSPVYQHHGVQFRTAKSTEHTRCYGRNDGGLPAGTCLSVLAYPTRTTMAHIATSDEIRPFHVNVPDAELADLSQRLAQTRLPDKETVTDYSQGVPLKTVQQVLSYWQSDYDWRKVEARLNAVPNFITEIDGLDIHFIHARSKHENALPIIVTHGWPGSIVEQLKINEPLTNPTAHGGSAADAFHVIVPSMPGYGYSGKPTSTGWGPERIAR